MKIVNHLKNFLKKYWMCIAFTIFLYFYIIIDKRHIPYDFEYYHYPILSHLYNSLYKGIFPLWNPYTYGGQSFIANPQVGAFYPLTYLPFLLGLFNHNMVTKYMCEYIIIISIGLGMCGFYRLFLRLKFNKFLSFLGAVLVMFGGFSVSQYQHLGVIEIISILPYAFYIWLNIINNEGKNNWLKLAILDSLIIFTGFLPYALSYFVIEVIILFVFSNDKKKIILNGIRHYFIVVLLTCVMLLPTAANAGVSRDLNAHAGLDFHNLLSLFEPNLWNVKYGIPNGYNHQTYDNLWAGILFPIFLVLGLVNQIKSKDDNKWYYLLLYLLFLMFVYKPTSAFISSIINHIPGVGSLWRGEDFLIFVHVATVIFVIKGIEYFIQKRKNILLNLSIIISMIISIYLSLHCEPYHLRTIAIASSIAICFGIMFIQIYNKISIKKVEIFILISFVFQLSFFQYNIHFYSADNSSHGYEYFINTELYDALREDKGTFRVFAQQSTNGAEWTSAWPTWKLESVNGYDPTVSYDFITYMSDFSNYNDRMFDLVDGNSDKLQFLNIKYVVTREDGSVIANNNNFELVKDGFYRTYKYKNFKERYLKISNVKWNNNISIKDLNKSTPVKPSKKGETTILKVDAKENDLLYISDQYNDDWHAKINGKEVNIRKVNKIFMAIPLTEGINNIEIYYRPIAFVMGAIISIISWISLIIIYIFINKKKA